MEIMEITFFTFKKLGADQYIKKTNKNKIKTSSLDILCAEQEQIFMHKL